MNKNHVAVLAGLDLATSMMSCCLMYDVQLVTRRCGWCRQGNCRAHIQIPGSYTIATARVPICIISKYTIPTINCFRCCHSANCFLLSSVLLMQAKFPSPEQVHLHCDAMLYINHSDVAVECLDLDGALVVEGQQGSSITIDGLQVHNEGWEWQPLEDSSSAAEHERIRCVTPKLLHNTCCMRQIWSMSMICSSCIKCNVPLYLLAPADRYMLFAISMWIDAFVVLGTYQYTAHIFLVFCQDLESLCQWHFGRPWLDCSLPFLLPGKLPVCWVFCGCKC